MARPTEPVLLDYCVKYKGMDCRFISEFDGTQWRLLQHGYKSGSMSRWDSGDLSEVYITKGASQVGSWRSLAGYGIWQYEQFLEAVNHAPD